MFKIEDLSPHLINYANLQMGIIGNKKNYHNINDLTTFKNNIQFGLPILLPDNLEEFSYNKNEMKFSIQKKEILKIFFGHDKADYIGYKMLFNEENIFVNMGRLKRIHKETVEQINKINMEAIKSVRLLRSKYKSVVAFQCRNIPHLGHERIIDKLLNEFDCVVINPFIGPKKSGDIGSNEIEKAFKFIIDQRKNQRLQYIPFITNFYYAGPREACHQALIRSKIGFTHFVIGRDHAGAEDVYNINDAANIAKKYEKELNIKIINIPGAYFCKNCNKVVIKDECQERKCQFINISGTDYRKKLIKKEIYEYANTDLQKYLLNESILKYE